ncbi:MAG: hypothetical protein S4CHLAM6_02790 [Chlamydiae bacterium]|nr:hypothetical protein [Chlamydiota bacterium]
MQGQKSSLIVVSNRLPISIFNKDDHWEIKSSTGGLASALTGVREQIDFTWIGWPGASFLKDQEESIRKELKKKNLVPIFINQEQEEHFYHTFCNSILWPLFHYFTDHITHTCSSWKFYEQVNKLFANEILELAEKNATIWVHDFHLMLLPGLLREKRPDLKIGFFLHIPFPSSEIYRMFPKREALLKGVLGADYIGFHTSDYARHFRLACLRVLGCDSNSEGVTYHGKKVGIGVNPIGMNIKSFDEVLSNPSYSGYIQEIQSRYKDHQVILGVERLDYTKGISLKLQAFEHFLEKNPKLVGKVVLLQIIVPSRHDSIEYQRYRSDIEKAISRLNGKYSKPGFIPVQYIYRNLPLEELIALYCLADVCVIASIRDGMNLVAQEFVYCASKMPVAGALLLSEFAGVSHHLPHAALINPLDIEGLSEDLKKALEMPEMERKNKIDKMAHSVVALDSPLWAKQFLEKLELVAKKNNFRHHNFSLSVGNKEKLLCKAQESSKRIIILDYDGTLREITSLPTKATPTDEILQLLRNLSSLKNTEVHIVSGRDAKTLQAWLGDLPISLSAEHGFKHKSTDADWQKLREFDMSWAPYVNEVLEKMTEEVPGSFLETKECSLCWHYRLADLDYGEWRAKELYTSLIHDLANLPVEIITGKKVIEIRAQGVSKGQYIQHILDKNTQDHFIMCMGDDRTDLEMYSKLPKDAISIHIGECMGKTTFQLESPAKARELLKEIYSALSVEAEASLD